MKTITNANEIKVNDKITVTENTEIVASVTSVIDGQITTNYNGQDNHIAAGQLQTYMDAGQFVATREEV